MQVQEVYQRARTVQAGQQMPQTQGHSQPTNVQAIHDHPISDNSGTNTPRQVEMGGRIFLSQLENQQQVRSDLINGDQWQHASSRSQSQSHRSNHLVLVSRSHAPLFHEKGHLKLPPIQNIGGRTNVTQVEQVLHVSDGNVEQKTERSMTPCLITTEQICTKKLIHLPQQNTFGQTQENDCKSIVKSNRLSVRPPLNVHAVMQQTAVNDDQIETDRIFIQQIIYQNQQPVEQSLLSEDGPKTSEKLFGVNGSCQDEDLLEKAHQHSQCFELDFGAGLEAEAIHKEADIESNSGSEKQQINDVLNACSTPNQGTNQNAVLLSEAVHGNQTTRRQQIQLLMPNRSNSQILHDGSQLSFRAPLQTTNPPLQTSSSSTQLAFSSLVTRENLNLQRRQLLQQSRNHGSGQPRFEPGFRSIPQNNRFNFGELGRQSLEEERRRDQQERVVSAQNNTLPHNNLRNGDIQCTEPIDTPRNQVDQTRPIPRSIFDNYPIMTNSHASDRRFGRASRIPTRVNSINIVSQQQNQQQDNAVNQIAENQNSTQIRPPRFQDRVSGSQAQQNQHSPSSSGSNSGRSRVRSLDINHNQYFGARNPSDHIQNQQSLRNSANRQGEALYRHVGGGLTAFSSMQSVQQRTLNRYQSYTGLRSVTDQQNNIHFNRRQRPQFFNSRQVRGHLNQIVSQMGRGQSRVTRHQQLENQESNDYGQRLDRNVNPTTQNDINHEDLNFGDIDILEDELRRSNNNGGAFFLHNFNQLDSSIQNFGSSQQDGLTQSRQEELMEQNEMDQQQANSNIQGRNLTLSRMLHIYRNRRSFNQHRFIRSGASDNGADHFMPRTLTQNFMNNEGVGGSGGGLAELNSFGGMLSNSLMRSQTINRRSENFRQNQNGVGPWQENHTTTTPLLNLNIPVVNTRLNNLRNIETQTIQENIEHLDLLDGHSNNQNDNVTAGGARFTPQENRIQRRPMSRAAGIDSRPNQLQQNIVTESASLRQNEYFQNQIFPSPNSSSNQTHVGADGQRGLRLFPRVGGSNIQSLEQLRQSSIDITAEQQTRQSVINQQTIQNDFPNQNLTPAQLQRQTRRARYLNIFRSTIPTFDDNFMSRSETQIQNQLYQRGMGLPPRLTRQTGANLLVGTGTYLGAHYQSISNLPTLNEVNEQNLFRNYRSGERLYGAHQRESPEQNQFDGYFERVRVGVEDQQTDQNYLINGIQIGREQQQQVQPSSSDDTQQIQATDSVSYRYIHSNTQSITSNSSQNIHIDDRQGITHALNNGFAGNQWTNGQNNATRTRISPAVRRRRQLLNRRNNDDISSYIGRGTHYLRAFNQMRSQAIRQVSEAQDNNINRRPIQRGDEAERIQNGDQRSRNARNLGGDQIEGQNETIVSPLTRQAVPVSQVIRQNDDNDFDNQSSNEEAGAGSREYLNSPMFLDKRSKLNLVKIYNKLKQHIPKEWRTEELSRDIVTQQDFYVTYLESYGPLAVLIYLRTQNLVNAEKKQQQSLNFETEFKESVYASVNELSYQNYGRNHDFIKFLVKILQFYQGNLELALEYKSQEAYTKLQKFLTSIVPSCKQLRKILKQKRKSKDNKSKKANDAFCNNEFSIYEENIIYIVILLIMESFFLQFDSHASCHVKSNAPSTSRKAIKRVKSLYQKDYLPLALELYTHHVQSSDLVLLNSLLSFNNVGHTSSSTFTANCRRTNHFGTGTNPSVLNENRGRKDASEELSESIFKAKTRERKQCMIILNYFPNLKAKYKQLLQTQLSQGCTEPIDLMQYNVQDRVDYYNDELMRLRNSEGMDDESAFQTTNCMDFHINPLSQKLIEEANKAASTTYPYKKWMGESTLQKDLDFKVIENLESHQSTGMSIQAYGDFI